MGKLRDLLVETGADQIIGIEVVLDSLYIL